MKELITKTQINTIKNSLKQVKNYENQLFFVIKQ